MRKVLYVIILLSLSFAPLNRMNVAKLAPVQAVAVYMEDDTIVLETDLGNQGRGNSVRTALEDLKKNTVQVVYLDTVELLIVSEKAVSYVDEMRQYIKSSVRVGVCEAKDSVKEAAEYLKNHEKLPQLRNWRAEK